MSRPRRRDFGLVLAVFVVAAPAVATVTGASAHSGAAVRAVARPATGGACGPFMPRQASIPRRAVRCVEAPWRLLEAGPGGRSVVLQHGPIDACFGGPGRALVTTTAKTIDISVFTWAGEDGLEMACSQRLVVRLPSPIDGRRLIGQSTGLRGRGIQFLPAIYLTRPVPDPPFSNLEMPLVPRILHLSPPDATGVLRLQGFRPITIGHGREIVHQRPGRGQVAPGSTRKHPYAGSVQLTLGP